MTKTEAETTVQQLAGSFSVLIRMIGAHTFVHAKKEDFLSFEFKAGKSHNFCKITLEGDLYTMELGKIKKKKSVLVYTVKDTFSGVFDNQLKPIFERTTGLSLTMPIVTLPNRQRLGGNR